MCSTASTLPYERVSILRFCKLIVDRDKLLSSFDSTVREPNYFVSVANEDENVE